MLVTDWKDERFVLTADAVDLQHLLTNGDVTSEQLVELYLLQIDRHNKKGLHLNAVISVAPLQQLKARAKALDDERATGKFRGQLHGIPILVKDNIMTEASLGMDTTCGSFALKGAKAKTNAAIVDLYLDAGVIILGKTNLSEWAGKKGSMLPCGWSAVGGQTQTPYIIGGFVKGDKMLGHSNCGGSSSGSAASVAAGFAPVALGTETDGSIAQPAGRSSLYGMKVTVGSADTRGTSPYSEFSDSVGAMARSARDLAVLIGVMLKRDFTSDMTGSWKGQRVAFIDQTGWGLDPAVCEFVPEVVDKQHEDLRAASEIIEKSGGRVVRGIKLPTWSDLEIDGRDGLDAVWDHDFCREMEGFLDGYVDSPIKTVADIVKFNNEHADIELPDEFPNGQSQLEDALGDMLSDDRYDLARKRIRDVAKVQGFDKAFAENDVDVIVSLLDCRVGSMSAAAGYLHATVPLGYADNYSGRAYGLTIVAAAGREDKALSFMSAWEASHPELPRPPPQMLSS